MNRMALKKHTTYRQRQAQLTREIIAASARRLFAERGYVATTIQAISDAAEIPVPTIYSALGNKPAILEEIRRAWIAESGVEDLHHEALSTSEPRARLRLAALPALWADSVVLVPLLGCCGWTSNR